MFWNPSEAAPVDISPSYQMPEGLIPEFPWDANALIQPMLLVRIVSVHPKRDLVDQPPFAQ
jgi:hypothetical protein